MHTRRLAVFPLIIVLGTGTDRFLKEYLTCVSCAFWPSVPDAISEEANMEYLACTFFCFMQSQ